MENYKAFFEFAKGIICPETSDQSVWIRNEGNDPADQVERLKSAIMLMDIIGEE